MVSLEVKTFITSVDREVKKASAKIAAQQTSLTDLMVELDKQKREMQYQMDLVEKQRAAEEEHAAGLLQLNVGGKQNGYLTKVELLTQYPESELAKRVEDHRTGLL